MNDWKKAVVGSALAFCFISAFVGIFSQISVVQMTQYDLVANGARVSAYGDFLKDIQILSTVSLAVLVVCAVGFVFCFFHLFWNEEAKEKIKKIAVILSLLIAVFSLALIVATFLMPTRLEAYNSYYSTSVSYYNFTYYQACLSGVLSGFLPVLFGAGVLLCYRFFTARAAKVSVPGPEAE
ncbi:MAG: hypothetical protein J5958_07785 [Clostridia bacterium]|nr:hypothetical protein [Clostridia bacterium]